MTSSPGAADASLVVLFPGALGDLCLLAPALAARLGAGTPVVLSVQRTLGPVVRMLLPAAEVGPPIDGMAMRSLFGGTIDAMLAARLRAAGRVHAWLRRGDDDGALSARFAALGVSAALHAVPRDDAARHASLDYAEALGVSPSALGAPHAVAVPTEALPWRRLAARRLVLHPGAGAPAKIWAFEGFRAVADAWEQAGGEVVVLLGPAEEAQAAAWRAVGRAPVEGLGLVDAAAVIASAPCWLGNDSGMSHLAGALDRAGVVVFTATRAARWRPLGGRLATVEAAGRGLDVVKGEVWARLRALETAP